MHRLLTDKDEPSSFIIGPPPMSKTSISSKPAETPARLRLVPPVSNIIVDLDRPHSGSQPRTRLTRSQLIDISTVLDVFIVITSTLVAIYLYGQLSGGKLRADGDYPYVGVVTGLLYFIVTRMNLHNGARNQLATIGGILLSLTTAYAILVMMGYALKQTEVHSRLWLALSFGVAFTLLSLKSWLLTQMSNRQVLKTLFVEKVALFGDATIFNSLKNSLEQDIHNPRDVRVYGCDINGTAAKIDSPSLQQLIADGLKEGFDRIIFCLPGDRMNQVQKLQESISFLPARVEVCLAMAEIETLKGQLAIPPAPILVDLEGRPDDTWARVIKRAIDLLFGTLFLIILSPLMIAAAVAIKLEGDGPIFFRQRRHGWNHYVISVWKFRTMKQQAEGGKVTQAVRGDSRVTKVGRFLRKSSIDELPQLFNVLSGEMSLIGPRPHAVEHNIYYSELIDTYAARHKVRPGLTGWAQVKGLRGNSEDISKMIARADADIWYIRNWSIMLDLKILAMTPIVVLFQKEAL